MEQYDYEKYVAMPDNLKEVLEEYGVAIIPNVLNTTECDSMLSGIWDYFEHISHPWFVTRVTLFRIRSSFASSSRSPTILVLMLNLVSSCFLNQSHSRRCPEVKKPSPWTSVLNPLHLWE